MPPSGAAWDSRPAGGSLSVMRVLMTTTGYPGHLLPLLPFARACSRAGHDVRIAAPGASAPFVERLGFGFRPLPDPPEQALRALLAVAAELPRQAGHEHLMARGFGDLATRTALPSLVELIGGWGPDVVLRESHEFASVLAAEVHGVPHVRVALGVSSTEDELVTLAGGAVDAHGRAVGLGADPSGDRLRAERAFSLTPPILEAPASSAPHGSIQRFRDPRPSAPPLPAWWRAAGGPLVYVTFGSAAPGLGFYPDLYRVTARALGGLDARVLLTVGGADPEALGPLPPNVHVERWVPQERILPHAAAVVCHGGYGSTLGALNHGVPLLMLPLFGADQWTNARRVADVGAGIALAGDADGERRLFDGPGADVVEAIEDAATRLIAEARYATGARRVEGDMALLAPIEQAAPALAAIGRAPAATSRSRAPRRAGSVNESRASGRRSSDAARRSSP